MKPINLRIAEELGVREQQVAAAISLLDGGATVPFVARYRKEATGALDDAQLRTLEERLRYLRELDERRAAILDSIGQQGKLDAALKQAIDAADSKARLEDLYLPYRPKRRTKAQIAREAGLEPLAEALLARPDQSPEQVARRYVEASKGVIDSTAALEGARAILVERFSRRRHADRDPARGSVVARPSLFASSCRQGGARRQVRRLFRVQRASG